MPGDRSSRSSRRNDGGVVMVAALVGDDLAALATAGATIAMSATAVAAIARSGVAAIARAATTGSNRIARS